MDSARSFGEATSRSRIEAIDSIALPKLDSIRELQRLELLADRLLDAKSWAELLADGWDE